MTRLLLAVATASGTCVLVERCGEDICPASGPVYALCVFVCGYLLASDSRFSYLKITTTVTEYYNNLMINILMNWWRLAIINYNFYIHLDGIYVCVFFFLFIFVLCLSHSDCVFVSHSFSLAPFAQYIYDDDIFFIVDCYQFEWISSHFVALRCWDSLSHNVWWTVVVLGIEIGVWKTDILGLWMSGPGASRHGHRISVCLACLPFCCICISICVGRQEIEKQNAKCRLQTEVRRCAMEIVPIHAE